jgi:Uncharacterized protein conserved in bacteria (DUF2125)
MLRRIPLWLTLVPLVAGIIGYYLLWQGWARDFEALVEDWLPEAQVSVSGFPYRLEADVKDPTLRGGGTVKLLASAPRIRINQGPWKPQLTIVRSDYPRFSAVVGPGFGASIAGRSAVTSINVVGGKLIRLSSIIDAANARLGFADVRIAADEVQLHARERFPETPGDAGAPTQPVRGQLVISGQRVRLDGGDALTLASEIAATGAERLTDFAGWARTGTIEVERLALADAHGEVALVKATLVPVGGTGIRMAGTIETICPASVEAAVLGVAAPAREMRLRSPVRLAFDGVPGAVRLTGMPDNLVYRATRGQVPPCPRLR